MNDIRNVPAMDINDADVPAMDIDADVPAMDINDADVPVVPAKIGRIFYIV